MVPRIYIYIYTYSMKFDCIVKSNTMQWKKERKKEKKKRLRNMRVTNIQIVRPLVVMRSIISPKSLSLSQHISHVTYATDTTHIERDFSRYAFTATVFLCCCMAMPYCKLLICLCFRCPVLCCYFDFICVHTCNAYGSVQLPAHLFINIYGVYTQMWNGFGVKLWRLWETRRKEHRII